MSEPRLLDRRTAYAGRVLEVGIDRLRLPDGGTTELEIIRHGGAAVVVPVTAGGEVLLVRQYRYATGRWLLEAPAGKLAPGEAPERCAERELEEETGWRARQLLPLGAVWSSPGFTDELLHLYLARGLEPGSQALEEGELLTVETLPLFAYGTLTDPVFAGRLLERRLVPEPAVLLDHQAGELPGLEYRVVVPAPGKETRGLVYRFLTAADYERLDAYEGVAEGLYERRRAEVRAGAGGAAEPVFVYVPTDRALRRYR